MRLLVRDFNRWHTIHSISPQVSLFVHPSVHLFPWVADNPSQLFWAKTRETKYEGPNKQSEKAKNDNHLTDRQTKQSWNRPTVVMRCEMRNNIEAFSFLSKGNGSVFCFVFTHLFFFFFFFFSFFSAKMIKPNLIKRSFYSVIATFNGFLHGNGIAFWNLRHGSCAV